MKISIMKEFVVVDKRYDSEIISDRNLAVGNLVIVISVVLNLLILVGAAWGDDSLGIWDLLFATGSLALLGLVCFVLQKKENEDRVKEGMTPNESRTYFLKIKNNNKIESKIVNKAMFDKYAIGETVKLFDPSFEITALSGINILNNSLTNSVTSLVLTAMVGYLELDFPFHIFFMLACYLMYQDKISGFSDILDLTVYIYAPMFFIYFQVNTLVSGVISGAHVLFSLSTILFLFCLHFFGVDKFKKKRLPI